MRVAAGRVEVDLDEEISYDGIPTLTEIINTMNKEKLDLTAKRLDYLIYAMSILIKKTNTLHPEVQIDPNVMEVLNLMAKTSIDRINKYGEEARAKDRYLALRDQMRELENDYPILQDLK